MKGLDYALLRKIRDQEHRLPDGSSYSATEEQPEEKDESALRLSALLSTATVTSMGANLKAFLLSHPLDNHGSSSSGSGGSNPLARLAFEFSLGPGEMSEEQDIPTTISRSKQVSIDSIISSLSTIIVILNTTFSFYSFITHINHCSVRHDTT